MMNTPYHVTTADQRRAEYDAARDIIQEFLDDDLLTQALIRCAPMLIAAWASEQASPTASVGEAMHQLRREAFELLRLMDAEAALDGAAPLLLSPDSNHRH